MATTEELDAIIIGAGQAGGPLARAFASSGKRTAIVEREHVGGTCVNDGCTPTKTMIASARAGYVARRAVDYGFPTTVGPTQMTVIRGRKRAIVDDFRKGGQTRLERQENLELIWGEGTFAGERTVEVAGRRLTAPIVVIDAGARPSVPDLPGLDQIPYVTSTTIMELDRVPEHLIVIGGGYVGLEFAQMFRRFGSSVTIIQRSGRLLGREDDDVAGEVTQILRGEGIDIILHAGAKSVENTGNGRVRLTVTTDVGERAVEGSDLLLAAGRTPNTDSLNAGAAGIELDARGYIRVNERLETTAPGVFATGDVHGGPAFTHIAYDDYRILEANLLRNGDRTTRGRLVPYTVFIDPQLGRVGMTETEAQAAGRQIRVAKLPMSQVARALETDETRGFMKVIVDLESGEILGCAILGMEGGEIMGALQIAMMGKLQYTELRDAVFAHPTLIESLNNLFMTLS